MKPLKFITETGSLEYYDKELVEKVLDYFENVVKREIRERIKDKENNAELAEAIDRVNRSRRAEEYKKYDSRYDRFANYVMFLLDKTGLVQNILDTFPNTDIHTIVCIIAAHIRKRLQ